MTFRCFILIDMFLCVIKWAKLGESRFSISPVNKRLGVTLLQYLNPIAIWVLNKCKVLHFPCVGLFYKFNTKRLKARTGLSHIIYLYSNVTKSLGLAISIMVRKLWVILCTIVMREFNQSRQSKHPGATLYWVLWNLLSFSIAHKVQTEFHVGKIQFTQ